MGKVLWVDLSRRKLVDEVLEERFCRSFMGGYFNLPGRVVGIPTLIEGPTAGVTFDEKPWTGSF